MRLYINHPFPFVSKRTEREGNRNMIWRCDNKENYWQKHYIAAIRINYNYKSFKKMSLLGKVEAVLRVEKSFNLQEFLEKIRLIGKNKKSPVN